MSLAEDIVESLKGFTKAMYSTWFFHKASHILFDAGEGVSARLANRVFAVEKVFLTHGHYDHVGGVPGIVLARNSAMGETTKPLTVYHPAGDALIQLEREYVMMLARNLDYELKWQPLKKGDQVSVAAGSGKWTVEAFATTHARNRSTLGYRLCEKRRRLKPEFSTLSEKEIASISRREGLDAVMEDYSRTLLAYTGDTTALDPELVREAVVLMHESTFLGDEDRHSEIHATIGEVVEVAAAAKVGALCLFHVSTRYRQEDIEAGIRKAVQEVGLDIPVWLFHLNRRTRIR